MTNNDPKFFDNNEVFEFGLKMGAFTMDNVGEYMYMGSDDVFHNFKSRYNPSVRVQYRTVMDLAIFGANKKGSV